MRYPPRSQPFGWSPLRRMDPHPATVLKARASHEPKKRLSRPPTSQHVGIDGQDDDDTGDGELPFLRDRHDAQAVGEHAHDEGTDDGAEYRAAASGQRGAADHDRRDRIELIALPESGLGGVDAGCQQETGHAADATAEAIDRDLPAVDIDAGEP